tara:strand:+ start:2830 stop:4254 length:1425 start_codon:yes stop_codon:yes gene_type:complete
MLGRSRIRENSPNIWPGFVDAISTLLIIIIFVLMVFTIAQFFLSEILTGRNDALDRLNRQIAQLSEVLALEQKSNENLKIEIAQLSTRLQTSLDTNDKLMKNLTSLTADRDELSKILVKKETDLKKSKNNISNLIKELGIMTKNRSRLEQSLVLKERKIKGGQAKIRLHLQSIESLKQDIERLNKVRLSLENRIISLVRTLEAGKKELTTIRDKSKALKAELASQKEQTAVAQKEITEKNIVLHKLQDGLKKSSKRLSAEQLISKKNKIHIDKVSRQLSDLKKQLAKISLALEASEEKAKIQKFQIVNLGKRLNQALAHKVEELARFRSEFFGKLRKALGNTQGVTVEGDRFVFQSEVLFPSSSTALYGRGENQIIKLARTLKDISARIPADVDWILRVDGHTDSRPIQTASYPSNWELSAARAIAVVKKLVAQGIPPHRLAAAGFGEFRPIDSGKRNISLERNRRIEFKLTGR